MSGQVIDGDAVKAAQKKQWDGAAPGWRRWWPVFENSAQHVSGRLVELAAIGPGHHVLDIATGIGEPAVTVARKVGAGGRVVATDQAPEMLAIGRERALALGLGNIEFQEVDAETIDFPEATFDGVVCRWGLMFLPDLQAALRRIHAVLKPGARFAAAVLPEPPRIPLLSLAIEAAAKHVEILKPAPGMPGPFSLAGEGVLEQAFRDAGFADVSGERLSFTGHWPSVDDYVAFTQDVAAPIRAALESHPEATRDRVWHAVGEAACRFATVDGQLSLENETICVVGSR